MHGLESFVNGHIILHNDIVEYVVAVSRQRMAAETLWTRRRTTEHGGEGTSAAPRVRAGSRAGPVSVKIGRDTARLSPGFPMVVREAGWELAPGTTRTMVDSRAPSENSIAIGRPSSLRCGARDYSEVRVAT